MAFSGNQITRIGVGGSGHAYAGFSAKAASIINKATFAVQSLITDIGSSVRATLGNSFAIAAEITEDGVSVGSPFDASGEGVDGSFQG